jgi:sugar (glycoside-pentoside-hexuronide) transporter
MSSKKAAENSQKIPFWDKMGYSSASMGISLSFTMVGFYLMYFYTDILGIGAAAAGVIMLVARIWDAVNDFMMGWAVDRFNLKWGKFRSWLLFGFIPYAIFLVLAFTVPPMQSYTGKLVWAWITYLFVGMTATLLYIPNSAQMVIMTTDSGERASISGIKAMFNNLTTIIIAVVTIPLVGMFVNPNNGFQGAAAIYGVVIVSTLFWCIKVTKKYEVGKTSRTAHLKNKKPVALKEQIRGIGKNKPLLVLLAGFLFLFVNISMRNALFIYWFEYYLDMADFYPIALLAHLGAMAAGSLLIKPMSNFCGGRKRAYQISNVLYAVVFIIIYLMSRSMGPEAAGASMNFGGIFWLFTLAGFFAGPFQALPTAIMPDTIEYGEWQTGNRQEGIFYAVSGFALTVGLALGGSFSGLMLDWAGYVANEVQSLGTLNKMLIGTMLIPIVFQVIQLVIMFFYNLSEKKFAGVVKDLEERKKKIETA